MAVDVTMPQMGADMTEGTLVKWLKQPGDRVERGEIIAEIETDKATVELEAFESGTMLKQLAAEGDTVPVGDVIAQLGEPEEATEERTKAPAAEQPPRRNVLQPAGTAPATITEHVPDPVPAAASSRGGRVRVSPVAKRIATDANIDLAKITGSGPDGRILRRDVEAFIESNGDASSPSSGVATTDAMHPVAPRPDAEPAVPAPASPAADRQPPEMEQAQAAPVPEPGDDSPARGEEDDAPAATPAVARPAAAKPATVGAGEPLSKMRQAIARRMTASKQQQPHYYLTLDIDMTDAMKFREQLNAAATDAQRVSINDLVVKACAVAIARHPKFNMAFSDNTLVAHDEINICIGIALDEGLIAPALIDTGNKSLGRIAEEAKDLIARAKSGKLRADEYSEGTFTITNLGAFGVETLIGIINPPQAAILGVGSVMPAAVVKNGEIVIRSMMKVALSADHRVSDGAEGARFIKEIQGLLENPASLAL